jgi:hypothetical protein
MDPDLPDEKLSKPPVDSRKTFPQANEVKEGATDPSNLNETEYLRYSRMVSLFEKERTFNNSIKKSIARINARILDCVSPEYHNILSDKKTAREKLVRLAQQFKPKGETRHQDLRNAWRYMLQNPIGKTSIERWLTNWSNLYDEAKSAEVPDICYHSAVHPEDRTAIRDFLQAVQPQDSYFSNHWRDKIQSPEVKLSFHEVLSAYRTHRSVQEQSKKGNSSAIAFAATLNGQPAAGGQLVLSNQKNSQQRCVCGSSKHNWKDCYHINASKRPPGWQQYEGSRKRVEEGIKKRSAAEQQEIAKMRSETSPGKTAQLAITNDGDLPVESMAFFSASISPSVFNAAMVFPLKSSWIVDSGANVHICNRRDRFEGLVEERRSVTLGTGGTITLGRGTAKVIIKNPTTGKILWATLQDVWYAPDFQTNVISVSEIKKNGFFFNSELPAITRDGKAAAMCIEQYGLYLLEHYRDGTPALPPPAAFPALKTSAKPLVSVASPQIWHRRLAHMYDRRIETLAGMVDGIEIKGEPEDNAQSNPERCEVCQRTRAKRQISRRPAERSHTFGRFGRLHFDLVQLDEAYNGHKWISHLFVEGIRLHMSQSHEKKSGCVDAIIKFIAICRNQLRMPIKVFKSDNEKTLGRAIKEYCEEEGILAEFSVIGTPEQNGFIERAGGIIITTARALILDSGLPKKLWPEAVRAAVYLINRTPTTLQNGQQIIPWVEAMRNQENQSDLRLNLSNLRLYGCRAYVRRQGIPQKDKMAPRAEIGYLVGYVASNIWRVWFPHLDTVREVRDVVFDENVRFNPKELEKPPVRDVLEAMPWSVGEYEEERTTTDVEELTLTPPATEEREEEKRDAQSVSKETTSRSPAPAMITPSPTASRDSTPTMAPTRLSAVPGAFPEERRVLMPQTSLNRLEAEGVRGPDQPEGPDQQLQGDLQATVSSPATLDISDSTISAGYRRRGSLAPRDINSSISDSNIVTGKRKRAYFASVASTEGEEDSLDLEDCHEGLLLAFTAGMSSPQAYQRPHRDDLPPEPSNWLEMMRHPHRDAFVEAAALEVKTLEKKGTYQEMDRPTDRSIQILPLTWVFTYKFDSNGLLVKYKARICVRGDLQTMSTEEKYSATLAVRTARAIFALAAAFDLDTAQFDAVNAFLNSLLDEEVYVELPPGLFLTGRRTRCWKLLRALYGLRKSPRLWQQEASRVLTSLGFKVVQEDICLFVADGIIVIFYVDDIIIFNHPSKRQQAADITKRLNEAWELRSMGEAQWFLGIRIVRDRQQGALWLCQDTYISAMATKYHLTRERRLEVPPVSIANLKPFNGTATDEQKHEFSAKVGSAQYATTITRPDAAKATSHLAQFLSNPSQDHINGVNQVIVYLYHTRTRAICYRRLSESIPQAVQFFSDASYGDNHDRRSSSGYICMIFGGPVDWRATKQKTVTTSTTEAELLAISEAGKSLCMWNRLFNTIMFSPGHPVVLQCDNQQTVSLLTKESPQLRTKLRHIDIHQHWLRQEVQSGRIPVQWVKTSDMIADGLTKLLPRQKHVEFVRLLGMEDIGSFLKGLVDD